MARIDWWVEARCGMYVHWGLYSIPGRGEWMMWCERTPKEEYARLADQFTPDKFNPEEWVKLARDAGMKYMVFTTRHHDGFSLFDSRVSEFTSVKRAAKKDFVADYVEACRKHGMRVGLYYSLLDWRYDAYAAGPSRDPRGWREFTGYVHAQVEELMRNYGKIDILWYDGQWPYTAEDWRSAELNAMVRKCQPDILINDRSRLPEDFGTQSEQTIHVADRPWECCMPLNDFWWGYQPGDRHLKTPYTVIRNLAVCASHGGNYILNVGPRPDGSVMERDAEILREAGRWLAANGESIYGTSGGVSNASPTPLLTTFGGLTRKPGTVYVHVFYWHREFCVVDVPEKIKKAYFLKDGTAVDFSQSGDRVLLKNLPDEPLDNQDTVIVLKA